jgi:hypothetical protein
VYVAWSVAAHVTQYDHWNDQHNHWNDQHKAPCVIITSHIHWSSHTLAKAATFLEQSDSMPLKIMLQQHALSMYLRREKIFTPAVPN